MLEKAVRELLVAQQEIHPEIALLFLLLGTARDRFDLGAPLKLDVGLPGYFREYEFFSIVLGSSRPTSHGMPLLASQIWGY